MTKKTFQGLTTTSSSAVVEGQLTHLRLRLAQTLRSLREKEGLTQAQLAERLGVKQAAISKLESPYKAHDLETILRVLASLNVEFVAAIRDESGLRPLTALRGEALVTVPLDIAEDAADHGLPLQEYICAATDRYRDVFEFNLKVAPALQPAQSGAFADGGFLTAPKIGHRSPASSEYALTA